MLALAQRLPRDQFAPSFIELSGPGVYVQQAHVEGIPVHTLGLPPMGDMRRGQLQRRVSKSLAYLTAVRAGRYDIIDAWLYPAYVVAALARPLTQTPIIVAGRRNLGDLDEGHGWLNDRVGGLVRRMTDAVVANSQAVADDALARGDVASASLRVIRNGVESVPPPTAIERAQVRARWGAASTDIVIGAVGNLRAEKGHRYLVRAFAMAAADDPRLHLVLVGDGPDRAAIEAEVRETATVDRVTMAGSVPDPRPLYGAFDFVVHPSLSEGLSNTLLEAGIAGLPIVATAVGGTAEIIHDSETGLLVPPGNVPTLAGAIARLARDAGLRIRTGDAARRHVEATFGMGRYVDEFANLYTELARRAGLVA